MRARAISRLLSLPLVICAACSSPAGAGVERVGAHAPSPVVQPTSAGLAVVATAPSVDAPHDQQVAELLEARKKQREAVEPPLVLQPQELAIHYLTQAYCQRVRREFDNDCRGELTSLQESDDNGLFTTTIVRVQALGGPEEVHLLIQSATGWDTVLLAENYSSGVGGFSHSIEVTASTVPDTLWAGVVENESHDSDLGDCRVTGASERSWVVCGLEGGRPRCAQVPLARESFEDVSSMLGREPDCAPPRVTREGFSRLADFDGTTLRFKRDPLAQFSTKTKAPANAALTLEQLFAMHRLPSSQH